MRKTLFTHGQVYNLDQVKELNKLIKGERYTLAIWWYGPKFK